MEKPHFPDAFAVVAGDTPAEEVAALRAYCSDVIALPPDNSIALPVAHHPDMLFAVVGRTLVTHRTYYHSAKAAVDRICALGGFTLHLSSMERGARYPRDIGFNAFVIDNALFGAVPHLCPELLAAATDAGMEPVAVRQGYAACSVLLVPSAGLAATADRGLANALTARGIHTVTVPQDSGILLPGYSYGFLGGCTGVWERTVFFCGNPELHTALAPLLTELQSHGVAWVPLSAMPVTDRGGIKIFAQK